MKLKLLTVPRVLLLPLLAVAIASHAQVTLR